MLTSWHWPLLHVCVELQTLPQAPQLLRSLELLMQLPEAGQ